MDKKQKENPRCAYLVRSWVYWAMPSAEASGYYFSRGEAERVKQELEAQYPDEVFTIEKVRA